MTQKTTLTLAEAHKVGETLQRDIDILQAEIAESSRPIKANVQEDQSKAVAARTFITESFGKLDLLVEASISLGEAIAIGNAQCGIDVLLKRRNLVTKHRQWIDGLVRNVKNQNESAIETEQAESFFSRMSAANSINSVQIKVVQADQIVTFKIRQAALAKQLDSINRNISSLNHSMKIELDLTTELTKILDC